MVCEWRSEHSIFMPGLINADSPILLAQLLIWRGKCGLSQKRLGGFLFESKGVVGIDDCIATVFSRVSPDLNAMLAEDFFQEEIDSALAQMHPFKSPGPDGFNASFFQHH